MVPILRTLIFRSPLFLFLSVLCDNYLSNRTQLQWTVGVTESNNKIDTIENEDDYDQMREGRRRKESIASKSIVKH